MTLLNRPRHGELVALAAAIALFVAMFFDWHGDRTAWQTAHACDAFQVLAVVLAVLLTATTVVYRTPAVPLAFAVWTVIAGLAASACVIERIVASPAPQAAAWVGLVAALGLLAGAWEAMRDETPPAPLVRTRPTVESESA